MKSIANKLYLFGDSICFGQLVNAHKTWAVNLSHALNQLINLRDPFIVQNAGVNGNTTRQALLRMHYDVISHRPDFLMIQFGMNDCNYWADDINLPRVSEKSFKANLEEMVDRGISVGVKHFFLNTNHPSTKGGIPHNKSLSYEKSNSDYNQVIREAHHEMVKSSKPVTLIDMEEVFNSLIVSSENIILKDLLLEDGIHLSENGHEVYIKYLIPIVIDKVKNLLFKHL